MGKMIGKSEKRYDGFAIVSFVLSLILPAVFMSGLYRYLMSAILFGFISFFVSIISGIISFKRIKNNKDLKGKELSWIAFIISLFIILWLIYGISNIDVTGGL